MSALDMSIYTYFTYLLSHFSNPIAHLDDKIRKELILLAALASKVFVKGLIVAGLMLC